MYANYSLQAEIYFSIVSEATKFDGHGLNVIVAANELDTAYVESGRADGVEALRAAGVEVHEV